MDGQASERATKRSPGVFVAKACLLALMAETVLSAVPYVLLVAMSMGVSTPWWTTSGIALGVVSLTVFMGWRAFRALGKEPRWTGPAGVFLVTWIAYNASVYGLALFAFRPVSA